MRYQKIIGIFSILLGVGLLAGCAKTPETSVVKQKGEAAMEKYQEAKSSEPGIDLRTVLNAPEHYISENKDATGKLALYTDAEVEIPEVDKVAAVYVSQHPFEQADIDRITNIFFEDADVYDARSYTEKTKDEWQAVLEELKGYEAAGNMDPQNWGTDENGNYMYDLYGEIEGAEQAYASAPEKRELIKLEAPYEFRKQDERFSLYSSEILYGFVNTADGTSYRYDMEKSDSTPMSIWIKKVIGESDITEASSRRWFEYDGMKTLYSWVPEEKEVLADIGISWEEAQKIADEKVAKLNIPNMEVNASEYVIELGENNSGIPQRENMTNVGYAFHYTRKLNQIPITYTPITGGGKEDKSDETTPWSYETLDIYVTKEGIDEVTFLNQYDMGETKAENLELMPFSEIMDVYEKMMIVQNADVLVDQRDSGGDIGEPLQARNYYIKEIKFGYTRIYDPQSNGRKGLLVPVWDFFGQYEQSYEGDTMTMVNDVNKSFLTINAVDGTVVDRWIGY